MIHINIVTMPKILAKYDKILVSYNDNNPLNDYWKYSVRFRFNHSSKLMTRMENLVNEKYKLQL